MKSHESLVSDRFNVTNYGCTVQPAKIEKRRLCKTSAYLALLRPNNIRTALSRAHTSIVRTCDCYY